ncbi:MAG: GTPase [Pirellulaceae bacterium]
MGMRVQTDAVAVELTGTGRGGVATVGVRGADVLRVVERCFAAARPDRPLEIGQVRYGQWLRADASRDATTHAGESVVLTRINPDTIEIHCHGGCAAVAAILQDLESAGASRGTWDDWFVFQGKPTLEAEAERVLVRTETRRTAAIANDQCQGAMRRRVEPWLNLEHAAVEWRVAQSEMDDLIERWEIGRHLAEPWKVVLAGAPNAGKSSLLNALIGYRRAITFDAPGTTRDVVAADTVIDGWPIQLSDTAGIRVSEDGIERQGVQYAERTIGEADLVVWVTDARENAAPPAVSSVTPTRTLLVRNKADLLDEHRPRLPSPDERSGPASDAIFTVAVHAIKDQQPTEPATVEGDFAGLETLSRRIVESLVGRVPEPGAAVPLSLRQVERLREARRAENLDEAKGPLRRLLNE